MDGCDMYSKTDYEPNHLICRIKHSENSSMGDLGMLQNWEGFCPSFFGIVRQIASTCHQLFTTKTNTA
jgi:hypothetical protein